MNSKNKGNSFERKVSKILSERFEQHTGVSTSFRRNIDSGSFFGGKNQARVETHDLDKAVFGDLVCPTDFKFSVECKHYKDAPSFSSILKQDCKTLDKWIEQAEQDSKNSGKVSLIIAKFNNVPEMAIVPNSAWSDFFPFAYKEHKIVLLDDLLKKSDDYFFL